MHRLKLTAACALGLLAVDPPSLGALDRWRFNLVLDGRVLTTPVSTSFLDSGLGKTRYGHEPRAVQAKLAQAAILGQFEARPDLTFRVHANVDAEHDFKRRLDLVEALAHYAPALGNAVTLEVRAGLFFPTVSLENTDPAWLSPYTTTFSAINSWIGEEVRTLGIEAGPSFRLGEAQALFFGAFNRGNDPSGTLLAWRGFALHDRVSGYRDRLPLPALDSFGPSGLFPEQPLHAQPMREVDHRWTCSAGLSLTHPGYRFRALYQPQTAEPSAFDGEQYAWRTGYWSAGGSRSLGPIEFLAQGLRGETRMGLVAGGQNPVIASFQAALFLVSWSAPEEGKHRATVRYDVFHVRDRDGFPSLDANDESGTAWTFAYVFKPAARHRITAEVMRVDSSRTNRRDLGDDPRLTEILGTLSWRLTF